MQAFTFVRPADATGRCRRRIAPGTKYIAGGTDLLQLAEGRCRDAGRGSSISRHCPARRYRCRTGRSAPRRAGAHERCRSAPGGDAGLAGAVAGAAGLGVAADPQHGNHGRQPAAAHALRLLPRYRLRLQQAPAGLRLPGDRWREPHAGDPRRQRPLHRHPPVRHGGGAAGARRRGGTAWPRRRSGSVPIADFHRLPGRHAAYRNGPGPGRDDHRDPGADARPPRNARTT